MKLALDIRQGSTFSYLFRWESEPIVYKPITAIAKTAPARITAPLHGLPDGWRVAVVSVLGMKQINAENDPPRDRDYHQATVIDANTVDLNEVNAAGFSTYASGGYLRFNTPVDLAGYTARMKIRDRVGGTELLSLTSANARIVIDNAAKTITLALSAVETEALTFTSGVYDLELVSAGGVVTPLAEGRVRVTKEITTTA